MRTPTPTQLQALVKVCQDSLTLHEGMLDRAIADTIAAFIKMETPHAELPEEVTALIDTETPQRCALLRELVRTYPAYTDRSVLSAIVANEKALATEMSKLNAKLKPLGFYTKSLRWRGYHLKKIGD